MAADPDYLTPHDLARRLRLTEQTLKKWRQRGEGPRWFRLGRSVRYRLADVEEWEREREGCV